ncbi:MAG: GAF domain-containing sensor histidine kinase [Chloroflexi bacterium]|nr:GAF domain-containing sensor histidine kinase [Chloroflexota bacterium]
MSKQLAASGIGLPGAALAWVLPRLGTSRGYRFLRWLTIVVPLVFLGAVDVVRHFVWPELHQPAGFVIIPAVVALAVYGFSGIIFNRIESVEAQLVRQNSELAAREEMARRHALLLRALHQAGLTLTADLSTEAVLQHTVGLARTLIGARYSALAVVDGRGGIARFLTSGLSDTAVAQLGDPPKGRGLLGAVLVEGQAIRCDDLSRDPRSVGFPAGHPAMTTFLGIPIVARGRTLGGLFVVDKEGPAGTTPFDGGDVELLELFAAQAAVAIENARLHAEVQALAATVERERIARELHDSLAQALGYIRLRAAAGMDALAAGDRTNAEAAFAGIGETAGDAYADVREAILGLRSRLGPGRDLAGALGEYLGRYRLQTGLAVDLAVADSVGAARLNPAAEVQLLRIVQEALTNVRKHARASRATVTIDLAAGGAGAWLRATIGDNGQGFDPAHVLTGSHYGLATMRERAESVGGRLTVDALPGRGTRVVAELPLEAMPTVQEEQS